MDFKLVSDYAPTGDQPEAIAQLLASIRHGSKHNTLLGVTGSGKTFTVANVISQLNRPTLVLSHNKTLAAQLYGEFKNFFPENAVEYFVSYYDYYQPEAYLPSTDTYIEKDLSINDEIEKMRLSTTATLLSGRRDGHRRFQRIVSVRLRQSERFPLDGHSYRSRRNPQLQAVPLQTGRSALYPDRTGTDPRDIPRDGRHDRHHGGFRRIRQPVFPRHLFRQRSREHPEHRPRNRPADPNARRTHPLPSEPVCHDQGAHTHGRAADLPRPGQANRLLRASGTSGRSAADQAAGGVRPGDDQGVGLLSRHRELLPLFRRTCRRDATLLPAGLFSAGLPDGDRREPRHAPPGARHVRRRPRPQGEPRGVRVPSSRSQRQPAAPLRGVRTTGRHHDLRERHTGRLRTDEERRSDRRTVDPADRTG